MGSFSPLKDWRILIFVGIILLVLLWWFLGGSVEEPDFSEKNISRDYCNITPESSETPSKENSSKEDSSKEDSFWSKTKTPDLQKKNRSFSIELDQNTANSPFGIVFGQNTANSPFDIEFGQNTSNSPFDIEFGQNTANSPFDIEFGQNTSNSPFDIELDQNTSNSSFDIELDQNTENSHFDIELSRDITRRSRIRPFFNGQQGPRTPLSTDPTMSMSVSVSLEDALATKEPKKTKAESKGESECRRILEEIYGRKFPSSRPDFLKNPESGHNLELDGYCEDLQIAFEYNGSQHYNFPNWIHKSRDEFDKQVRRDQYKIQACDRSGVYLITVPWTIPHNLIRDFIIYYLPENVQKRIELRENGEELPRAYIEECGFAEE